MDPTKLRSHMEIMACNRLLIGPTSNPHLQEQMEHRLTRRTQFINGQDGDPINIISKRAKRAHK